MKKIILIFIFLLAVVAASAYDSRLSENFNKNNTWHHWEDPPKEGELFMIVAEIPEDLCPTCPYKTWLIISHFDIAKWNGLDHGDRYNGWWEVKQENILEFFKENYPILYG